MNERNVRLSSKIVDDVIDTITRERNITNLKEFLSLSLSLFLILFIQLFINELLPFIVQERCLTFIFQYQTISVSCRVKSMAEYV